MRTAAQLLGTKTGAFGALLLAATIACLLSACGGGGGGNPQPQNAAPTADLFTFDSGGSVPVLVEFSARDSADSDGSIVAFEWDFNGDGVFDRTTATDNTSFWYTQAGDVQAQVRVRDDDGATDTAQTEVNAQAEDHRFVQVDPLSGGIEACLLVAGRPAIAYTNAETSAMQFVRASDSEGSAWGAPVTVDGDPISTGAMAIVDGNPAILSERQAGGLSYSRAGDSAGELWLEPQVLFIEPEISGGGELLICEGRPATFYRVTGVDPANNAVFFLRANDALGNSWPTVGVGVSSAGENPARFSGAIFNGRPALMMQLNEAEDRVVFRRAADAIGDTWLGVVVSLGTGFEDFDGPLRLRELAGRGYVAFKSEEPGSDLDAVQLFRASDPEGTAWTSISMPVALDGPAVLAVEEINGFPVVLVESENFGGLQLLLATDPLGLTFNHTTISDVNPNSAAMTEINGRPAVAFHESNGDPLRFAFGPND